MQRVHWERLLFIRPGALGDTLLLLPSLAMAHREWPNATITLVAREDVAQLALASGLADEISTYGTASWSALFSDELGELGPGHPLHSLVKGSAAVAWMADPDGVVSRNLRRLGAEPVILAPGRPDPTIALHMATALWQGLGRLGSTLSSGYEDLCGCMPRLATVPESARIDEIWRSLGVERRVVALHAGSGGGAKRWPPHLFAGLAEECDVHGLTPVMICGPQDAGCTREVAAACSAGSHLPVVTNLSLGQLSALLQRVAAFAGNDSGVTHLAALAGAPTLALFGPTNPTYWAPVGRKVHILRALSGRMEDISKDEAWSALSTLLLDAPRN
jgi:heptosyltransferase III